MPTESDLVRLAIRRNADAFGQLYQIHLDSIYRYIFYRVGSAPEAEDLTEQVFLKAWEHIGRYDERGLPFAAWLYRMAHNLVVDHYRTRRPTEELSETLVEAREGPAESVERRMEAAGMAAALRTLSPEHQQVIVLRFVQGLSHAEAAAVMGKTEGATRILQHRALGALHAALRSALPDEEPAAARPVACQPAGIRQ
jgi:RNA polymerase sigma-70 factor (ECF subfamily)